MERLTIQGHLWTPGDVAYPWALLYALRDTPPLSGVRSLWENGGPQETHINRLTWWIIGNPREGGNSPLPWTQRVYGEDILYLGMHLSPEEYFYGLLGGLTNVF